MRRSKGRWTGGTGICMVWYEIARHAGTICHAFGAVYRCHFSARYATTQYLGTYLGNNLSNPEQSLASRACATYTTYPNFQTVAR